MARFEDYHRTVVGYHGTDLASALRIINRIEGFRWSRRDFDWMGHGTYFWEHAPDQALEFARIRRRQLLEKRNPTPEEKKKLEAPIAVVASMIRLGFCFDLLDPVNVEYLSDVYLQYRRDMDELGERPPVNRRKYRRLDCAVFEYVYGIVARASRPIEVDTARGVYIPTDKARRVWKGSWISQGAHIQLCVRNPESILGAWLHHPVSLGVDDVAKALRTADGPIDVELADRPGGGLAQGEFPAGAARPDAEGPPDHPGAGGPGQEEAG